MSETDTKKSSASKIKESSNKPKVKIGDAKAPEEKPGITTGEDFIKAMEDLAMDAKPGDGEPGRSMDMMDNIDNAIDECDIGGEARAGRISPETIEQTFYDLLHRVEVLTKCVEKMATLGGNANHLGEFGLKRWTPEKKDLSKY